jgi:Tol biopolymer transport system component
MEAARVRAQLSRILTSAAFNDAGRASSFLRFIVEHALDGRPSEIKESVIAVEVLGRSSSFDSKTDPIVRVEAARLRDRLREYYDHHSTADDVLISVPKGGYVPQFSERQPPAHLQTPNVLRLSLLPPEGPVFDSFVISPDARRLAFTAYLNGRMMLWVRDLDSLDAKLLPGTETAAFPFWSPDSRSIGFFTPFKLRIIHAAGGPCRDIADVVLGRGGAWNRDGIIVFCPRPVGALHQIPAAGGTPEPVTLLDAARAEISHGFPQFLADGRRFLYFAASYRPGESSIRVGSLDSAVSKPLVGAETSAVYAPVFGGRSGCLLFVSHESLMAQPLDHQTLELRGEPEIVAQEVRYRRWGQVSVSVSSDGLLLYSRGTIDNYQFTWIDRQGLPVSTVGPSNGFASSPHYSFNLSPDERRVAIHRHDDPDTALATIWVMDLFRGGTLWRFTDPGGPEPEFCPVWSSSGVELLFSRGDDRGMRLLRQTLSGGSPACIVDTKGPKFPTDWSDDGRLITYNSQEPDYRYQHTWLASPFLADQPYPLLQHSHNNGSARFAPVLPEDGPRWIAYCSDETGRYEIYIRSFPGRGHKSQISNEGGFLPQWRRDGRELFYIAPDGTLMAVAVNPEAFEFGRPQKLFVTGLHLHSYSIWMNQYGVANDGQKFLLNRPAEGSPVAITAVISR